jgi:hypothetical protein
MVVTICLPIHYAGFIHKRDSMYLDSIYDENQSVNDVAHNAQIVG